MAFFVNVTDTGEKTCSVHARTRLAFPDRIGMVAGSWLEIGQSISFFCITSLLLVWSAGICAAGEYLMADSLKMLDSGRLKGA
jgi:phosphatidylinositol glycan class N